MVNKKDTAKTQEKKDVSPKKTRSAQAETTVVVPANHRTAVGVVVSDKMQKTIVVEVTRRVRHGLYQKFIERSRRFKAHDEKNQAKVGDQVEVVESRPLSREKRWVLRSIIRRVGQSPEANA